MNDTSWNIVIVDDDPSVCQILFNNLTKNGYNCRTASGAEDALALIYENCPDVVITDVRMPPGMNGIELLYEIKKLDEEIGVIIITAFADIESVVTALEAGANDYVIKPFFNLDEISICVARALDWRRLKLENREYRLNLEKNINLFKQGIDTISTESIRCKTLESELEQSKKQIITLSKVNKELEKTNQRLEKTDNIFSKMQDNNLNIVELIDEYREFCKTTAHSLKGEFMHIGMSAKELLRKTGTSLERKEEYDIIMRSIGYCQVSLRRLMDYFGMGKPPKETIEILELIRNTEMLAKPRLPSNIKLKTLINLNNIKGKTISTNAVQITGILMELIQNAVNALRVKGGIIEFKFNKEGENVVISVKDDGPGIPKEVRKDLLKKQVPSKGGLGLGLFLSNKVVNELGGKLNLRSSFKQGTKFTILLPIADSKEGS